MRQHNPVTAPCVSGLGESGFDAAFEADLDRLFRWRRDVRHFRVEPVEEALFRRVVDAAWLAPSVGLSQPWRFVTVDDPARRAAVRANFMQCNERALGDQSGERAALYARLKLAGLERAPRQIAVFIDPDPAQGGGLGRQTMPEAVAYSAVLAIHTLWLAARAAGLGVGWVSILDPGSIAAVLEVDPGWRFIAYLCLGYPDAESGVPELECAGWEQRRAPSDETLLRR